jgi:hypothetical protein
MFDADFVGRCIVKPQSAAPADCPHFQEALGEPALLPVPMEHAMVTNSAFSSDEWVRVMASPMVASMAITAAEPSGLWGILKEGMAGGWALVQAKQDAQANPLVKTLADAFASGEAREQARAHLQATFSGLKQMQLKAKAIDELRAVGAIVKSKAPQDAPGFKHWLESVAAKVAEAATEGGFLGFGGTKVSEAEKAALSEIAAALSSTSEAPRA